DCTSTCSARVPSTANTFPRTIESATTCACWASIFSSTWRSAPGTSECTSSTVSDLLRGAIGERSPAPAPTVNSYWTHGSNESQPPPSAAATNPSDATIGTVPDELNDQVPLN